MKVNLYVIHDVVAEDSGPVFEAKNDAIALRNYARLVKDLEFADEFVLYRVGSINHSSNDLVGHLPVVVRPVSLDAEASGVEQKEGAK